jgi:membrane-bound inhibitor of C-type lysozyme
MIELTTLAALLGAGPADSAVSLELVLRLTGNAERHVVSYQCEGVDHLFPVTYINAEPNFLAILPVEGKELIMVTVVSADGARYVSGPAEWWTRGSDATFSDTREGSPAPVNCTEANNTP